MVLRVYLERIANVDRKLKNIYGCVIFVCHSESQSLKSSHSLINYYETILGQILLYCSLRIISRENVHVEHQLKSKYDFTHQLFKFDVLLNQICLLLLKLRISTKEKHIWLTNSFLWKTFE